MRRAILLLVLLGSCSIRPGERRAEIDLEIGRGATADTTVVVQDGLAQIRALEPGRLDLWAQAPALEIELDASEAPTRTWEIFVRNVLPDAQATASTTATLIERPLPTRARWSVEVPGGSTTTVRIAAPDASAREPFVFGVMADVQSALSKVEDIFRRMNEEPDIRFIVASGDLTQSGADDELEEFQQRLETLRVPFFSTIGNHELFASEFHWPEFFGRANVHFEFKGVRFSLVDSGNGTLDPAVADWLDGWLEAGKDSVHVFATHIPPFDPVGTRDGGFASRTEAAALLDRLARGGVDITFYGHVHSYYAFENAGIPAYISGGGGALPEKLDGIGRHFLKVSVGAETGAGQVALIRID